MSATLHIFTETPSVSKIATLDRQRLHSEPIIEEIYDAIIERLRTTRITHSDRPNEAHWFLLTGILAIIYANSIEECDGPVLWALKDSLIGYGHHFVGGFDPYNYRNLIRKIEDKAIDNVQKLQHTILIPDLPEYNDDPYDTYDLLASNDEQYWIQIIVTGFNARECKVRIELDPEFTSEENEEKLKKLTVGGLIPLHNLQPPRCYRG
jgi:hypothetical protein